VTHYPLSFHLDSLFHPILFCRVALGRDGIPGGALSASSDASDDRIVRTGRAQQSAGG